MKVPKYIQIALYRRARAAEQFVKQDCIISQWITKKGIDTFSEELSDHVFGGAESLYNPYASAKIVIDCLERMGNEND